MKRAKVVVIMFIGCCVGILIYIHYWHIEKVRLINEKYDGRIEKIDRKLEMLRRDSLFIYPDTLIFPESPLFDKHP